VLPQTGVQHAQGVVSLQHVWPQFHQGCEARDGFVRLVLIGLRHTVQQLQVGLGIWLLQLTGAFLDRVFQSPRLNQVTDLLGSVLGCACGFSGQLGLRKGRMTQPQRQKTPAQDRETHTPSVLQLEHLAAQA
jgi:hypothetical protein